MLIEFFTKHNKLLIVMMIFALIGIWSVVGNITSIVIQLQHCNAFSSDGMASMNSIVCYIFGQV